MKRPVIVAALLKLRRINQSRKNGRQFRVRTVQERLLFTHIDTKWIYAPNAQKHLSLGRRKNKMSENVIEKTVCNKAVMAGWFVRKLVWKGRSGAPDRLFIKDGRVVFIEFKDTGKKPEPHQVLERERMLAVGAEHHVCDSIREGLHILGIE